MNLNGIGEQPYHRDTTHFMFTFLWYSIQPSPVKAEMLVNTIRGLRHAAPPPLEEASPFKAFLLARGQQGAVRALIDIALFVMPL